MSVLVNSDTRVLVQGITGKEGSFQTQRCIEYGTKVVAGVTPGPRRREDRARRPRLQHRRRRPCSETGADCSLIFVPPPFAADAILEAADAGIPLVVCITEGIPTLDMVKVKRALAGGADAPHRPELPRRHHRGRVPRRHHARPRLLAGQRRRRLAQRHARLRGRRPAHAARHRPVDVHRRRRRPDHRHDAARGARAAQRRPGHRRRRPDRRDRRQRRAGSRRLHQEAHDASPSSRSSPARRRRPAAAWATPARSSPATPAPPPRRRPRSPTPASTISDSPAEIGATTERVLRERGLL